MRLLVLCLGVVAPTLLGACSTDLGECDPPASMTVVYDETGVPAYAGQALVRGSCGNGSFCHSAGAVGANRFGAPVDLDFDMLVVSSTDASPTQTERLRHGIARVRDDADGLYSEVESGRMPPFGDATLTAHAGVPRYFFGDGERLVPIDRLEGLETFRNWLACGAPVVERTTPRPAGVDPVGDIVAARSPTLEPTWTDVYSRVLFPQCGSSCHGPALPVQLELSRLDLSDKDAAYAALIDMPAAGISCGEDVPDPETLVVPMDPDASLLVRKMRGFEIVTCGDPMPPGGALPDATVEVVAEWIRRGAAND
jgi:hypothetical protein